MAGAILLGRCILKNERGQREGEEAGETFLEFRALYVTELIYIDNGGVSAMVVN